VWREARGSNVVISGTLLSERAQHITYFGIEDFKVSNGLINFEQQHIVVYKGVRREQKCSAVEKWRKKQLLKVI
jgi:hypothetical protein